jgi:RloB-like protein
MSLIQRQPRPLKRDDAARLRDDRLFIVACDDTYAPKQYFDFFKLTRVQVHVIPTTDDKSHATHVLEQLMGIDHEADDELWMLLDTDHCIKENHTKNFNRALQDASKKNVHVAISKPCFELWLLLHHINETEVSHLSNAQKTEAALRSTLGEYNKRLLKADHYPLNAVADACRRAKNLDKKGRIPAHNTSRVYLLWEAIVAKALPSQLPPELHVLLTK